MQQSGYIAVKGWQSMALFGCIPKNAVVPRRCSALCSTSFFAFLAVGVVLVASGEGLSARAGGEEVVVVYNTAEPESKTVADYYVQKRRVPAKQVFGFKLSPGADMSRAEYRDSLLRPLVAGLKTRGLVKFGPVPLPGTNGVAPHTERRIVEASFRYVLLCYGVPWRILPDASLVEPEAETMRPEFRRNEAAVDSELACLPLCEKPYVITGFVTNRAYGTTNSSGLHPTNGVVMVARLDGPSAEIARGLVDKALEAERDGLWGRAYFDLRGSVDPTLKAGDDWIRGAAEMCRWLGLETVVDTNADVFPASFPMSQIAFYAGWYREHVCGPLALPRVEFMPGAFAYHLHSFSAANLRSTNQHWVGPLLAKGVTITMGCVNEPYLGGTPDIATFTTRLLFHGFSFGEAAYAAQSTLSWQTTVVGDPLYRPLARPLDALHRDLEQRRSPLTEWSYLRLMIMILVRGVPAANLTLLLENLEATKRSAVLMEKLGELYAALGKPSSSIHACEQALKLAPSPQQQVRIALELGEKLTAAGRLDEANKVYEDFLKTHGEYPDKPAIYRHLISLAEKRNKKDEASRFSDELGKLTATPATNNGKR